LTAIAGADALSHAIEAFTAVRRDGEAELAQQNVFVGKNAPQKETAWPYTQKVKRTSHTHTHSHLSQS
jgi:alcohol dehydrogenase class IV